MKFRAPLIIAALTTAVCCKPAGDGGFVSGNDTTRASSNDSLVSAVSPVPVDQDGQVTKEPINIEYQVRYEDVQDETRFEPFRNIFETRRAVSNFQDSLFNVPNREYRDSDSTLFAHLTDKAYGLILQYKERMKSGVKIHKPKGPPKSGVLLDGDQSHDYLTGSYSTLLNNADFMFMGGAPFVEQDAELYKDPNGNPEARYMVETTVNANYFFNYVYSRQGGPVEITYGPPLNRYEGMKVHVKGIGSLIHHLDKRIPVSFLTAQGTVPASLIGVTLKVGEEYGCVTNYPKYVFACSKNIPKEKIFGVFVSDANIPIDGGRDYPSYGTATWSYDLDGDSTIDLVRIESSREGAADTLALAIWYARINDEWVVIDYGSTPDCT